MIKDANFMNNEKAVKKTKSFLTTPYTGNLIKTVFHCAKLDRGNRQRSSGDEWQKENIKNDY
jgi:hypothetical protein